MTGATSTGRRSFGNIRGCPQIRQLSGGVCDSRSAAVQVEFTCEKENELKAPVGHS
jgi:hypothetical protein